MTESEAYAASIRDLSKRISGLGRELSDTLTEAISNPSRSGLYWRNIERNLSATYNKIVREFSAWAQKAIPAEYEFAARRLAAKIERTKKITATAKVVASKMVSNNSSRAIVQALVSDAVASMEAAAGAGLAAAKRVTRMTQQTLVEEWMIDASVARAYADGDVAGFVRVLKDRSPVVKTILDNYREERVVIAGSKTYKLPYYAEMVARTKWHEAQSHAAIATATNYGTDLVQVSSHNTTTEICQAYEGKIFSISGKDKRFPGMDQVPPYHPNCLHVLYPVFESALEVDGTLAAFSDYSLGKSDRPPVPAGFVPVAERTVE